MADHSLQQRIQAWNGMAVVSRFDRPTGAWIFICMHDNSLGSCTGGSRLKIYESPDEGLLDAMRLATGMTSKWAAIGEPVGGGKAVLALAAPLDGEARRGLLLRYGSLIESLNGAFRTGEDLGSTSDDMQVLAERTRFVHGFHPETGVKIDPSPFTAMGVFAGLKSAVAASWGSDDLTGRKVLVQGTGNVGTNLGRLVVEAGGQLLVSDIDQNRARQVASELGAATIEPSHVYDTECDVYAPCAIGATLNSETIPQLHCRIVAGSANNQLAEPEDSRLLLERQILYVPDYIINAGGAKSFALMDRGMGDLDEVMQLMSGIGETVSEILEEAAAAGISPTEAADRRVQQLLARQE